MDEVREGAAFASACRWAPRRWAQGKARATDLPVLVKMKQISQAQADQWLADHPPDTSFNPFRREPAPLPPPEAPAAPVERQAQAAPSPGEAAGPGADLEPDESFDVKIAQPLIEEAPQRLDQREAAELDAGETSGREPIGPAGELGPDALPGDVPCEPDDASVAIMAKVVGAIAETIPGQGGETDRLPLQPKEDELWQAAIRKMMQDMNLSTLPGWALIVGMSCWTFGTRGIRWFARKQKAKAAEVAKNPKPQAAAPATPSQRPLPKKPPPVDADGDPLVMFDR